MNNQKIKKIFILLVFGFFMWLFSNSSQGAYISVSPSSTKATPGQTITLTISSDCIGKVNLAVANGSLSASSVFIDGSQTVNLVVGNSGIAVVTATPIDMADLNGTTVFIPSKTTSISIEAPVKDPIDNNNPPNNNKPGNDNNTPPSKPTEKSSVATLSNLGIKPNDFSGFKSNTFTYSTEVPNKVESIEIYAVEAKGQEGKQQISGTGIKKLKEGTNTFEIVVTAEDGKTKKTYTLNIDRKKEDKKEEEKPEEPKQEEPKEKEPEEKPKETIFGLAELNIKELEIEPKFQTDIYEYKVELKEDVEKLDISTLATDENSSIEITGNESLQEGENIITIIVKGEKDDKIATYQIIVNKIIDKKNGEVAPSQKDKQDMIENIIICALGAAIIVIIIAIIILKVRKNKKANSEFVQYGGLYDYEKDKLGDDKDSDNKNDNNVEPIEEKSDKKKNKGKRFK